MPVIGQRRNRWAGVGLTVFLVACAWVVTGVRAAAEFADAHNASLAHVPARLSHCASPGTCQATFTFAGQQYLVTGASGRDGDTVTLFVERHDPYQWAQQQDPISAYGPLAGVVAATVLGVAVWLVARRRRRAQTPPAAS